MVISKAGRVRTPVLSRPGLFDFIPRFTGRSNSDRQPPQITYKGH
jgi:hypothetical protein